MKAKIIIIIILFSILNITQVKAGGGNIMPASISNTILSAAFSYPDGIKYGEKFNVSITFSVTFQNESINMVNITEVRVYLLDKNANVSRPQAWLLTECYGSGSLWTTDEFSHPLYTIKKPSLGESAFCDFKPVEVYVSSYFTKPIEAKLYIEIWFRIPGIYMTDVYGFTYPWYRGVMFTGAGETPIVTINSSPSPPNFTQYLIIAGASAIVLAIIVIAVLKLIKKGLYTRLKTRPIEGKLDTPSKTQLFISHA